MAQAQNQHPLSENELNRLEDLLTAGVFKDQAMRLDELQGTFCALASGPGSVAPSVWLPAVLGCDEVADSDSLVAEAIDLLLRFYNETAAALADGEAPQLLFYPLAEDADDLDYAAWADGYLYGTELGDVEWDVAAGEHVDDLADLMEAFYFLVGAVDEGPLNASDLRARDRAVEDIPDLLVAIHNFWRTKQTPVPTLRRDAPKVGRNDPCPCGSGKKFKQCCGDPTRMH